jgi:hypothetical protein
MASDISEEDRTTSLGLFRYSLEYFAAALTAHDALSEGREHGGRPAVPVYNMCGQAIELGLKAYLREQGANLETLRKIGHNLEGAFNQALAKGYTSNADTEHLKILNEMYATHQFRYIRTGFVTLLDPDPLFELVATVLRPTAISIPDGWRFFYHHAGRIVADKKWINPTEVRTTSKQVKPNGF